MYFKAHDGTYKRVPQIPNRFPDGEVEGMTVYCTSAYDNSKVTAFKPGFRVLAGYADRRTSGGVTKWNAICFRCYNAKNFGGDNQAPCSDKTVDNVELPNKACPGGIRTTVRFPTCWDSCQSCSGLWCTVEVEGGTDFYRTTGTEEINTGGVEELVECY